MAEWWRHEIANLIYGGSNPPGDSMKTKGVSVDRFFNRLASFVANKSGSWQIIVMAFAVVIGWAVAGPMFNFSGQWQLFINSMTTIITFLMVFLIQNEQNRNDERVQDKLDYLVKALGKHSEEYEEIDEEFHED